MRSARQSLILACREVFRSPWNVGLAVLVAFTAFLFAVWLPNAALIRQIVTGGDHVPLGAKLGILASLVGGIRTNFTVLSASYTILAALLLGAYAAMAIHYIRRRRAATSGGFLAAGIGGAVSGILGVGCAACGSFLLTGMLSAIGAGGALALLPLGGGEFGIFAVALLAVSVYAVARKISEPQVCGIEERHEQT